MDNLKQTHSIYTSEGHKRPFREHIPVTEEQRLEDARLVCLVFSHKLSEVSCSFILITPLGKYKSTAKIFEPNLKQALLNTDQKDGR